LLLQLPRRKEHLKEFSLRFTSFPSWALNHSSFWQFYLV
jgi:hypothetical protein